MKKAMKKSNYNYIILAIVLAIVVALTTLATMWLTGAWFTDNKNDTSNIGTAVVEVNAKQSGVIFNASDTKTLTSSSLITNANKIIVRNTSNISVYLRAKITCNWDEDYQGYERVYDVLSFTLGSNWNALTGSNANDKIFNNEFLYYSSAVAANTDIDILTAVSIKAGKSMPDDAKLNVFVEVVQADSVGKALFVNNDSELTNSNWSSVIS